MTPFEIELIKTYAACDMNAVQTGKQLYVHKSTVVYHFENIRRKTGLDPRRFNNLVELLLRIERGELNETDAEI